jgi:hypothetical protein
VSHQPKWRAKLAGSSITDPWVSSSDRTGEKEVTRPIRRDRDKVTVRKGKGKGKEKKDSSSQNESSTAVGSMMSTLERLSTLFAKAQLWKQWNKLNDCSTTNMDEEKLKIYHEPLQLIQIDLQFTQANKSTVENGDDK